MRTQYRKDLLQGRAASIRPLQQSTDVGYVKDDLDKLKRTGGCEDSVDDHRVLIEEVDDLHWTQDIWPNESNLRHSRCHMLLVDHYPNTYLFRKRI